jgi:hypothetical protein
LWGGLLVVLCEVHVGSGEVTLVVIAPVVKLMLVMRLSLCGLWRNAVGG